MKQAGKAILSFKPALPGQGDKGAKAKAKAKAQTLLFQLSRKLSQINSMSAPCASDNSSEIILLWKAVATWQHGDMATRHHVPLAAAF